MNEEQERAFYLRARKVFLVVLELEQRAQAAEIARLCEGDEQLRAEVESLLDYAETETNHLQPSLSGMVSGGDSGSGPERLLAELREGFADRLESGQSLSERYELRACLGRGGMGEVWQAEDRMLGETVALKFIHGGAVQARSQAWIDRLLHEVSAARMIAHPNVCRVYDAGEENGEFFLSMEYLPGGDLAERLREHGKLDREALRTLALEMTGALAAIHSEGLLHRDLKPANILFDARGASRLSDFGLALSRSNADTEESQSGTRAYMAPELLDSGAPSERSDLFALGLVLFEAASNRRAFRSGRQIARYAERGDLPPVETLLTANADPVLKRIILQCLSHRPEDRPESAGHLLSILEEPDFLTALLALGEVPTADVIAAANAQGSLGIRGARIVLAIIAAMLILVVGLAALAQGEGPLPRTSPAERTRMSHALMDRLEGGDRGWEFTASSYGGFEDLSRSGDWDYALPTGRELLRCFWLRESFEKLSPRGWETVLFGKGRVSVRDPALDSPRIRTVILDAEGRLVLFQSGVLGFEPGRSVEAALPEANLDEAFEAAGLERSTFEPVLPSQDSPARYGALSWTNPGHTPELRVEVTHAGSSLRSFEVLRPKLKPKEEASGYLGFVWLFLLVAFFFVLTPLAWRQLRSGRGDPFGALRLALACAALTAGSWFVAADYPTDPGYLALFWIPGILIGMGAAELLRLFYLAVEPSIQREFPRMLISWGRFLRGRWRDRLVRSHMLLGVLLGLLPALFDALSGVFVGLPTRVEDGALVLSGSNPRTWIHVVMSLPTGMAFVGIQFLAGLAILRAILRSHRAAYIALWGLTTSLGLLGVEHPVGALGVVLAVTMIMVVTVRVGVLTLVVLSFTATLLASLPIAPALDSWYASASIFSVGVVVALALATGVPLAFPRLQRPGTS